MNAGKLSRFAGLVFVLAALAGGTAAQAESAEHGTGGTATMTNDAAFQILADATEIIVPANFDWN